MKKERYDAWFFRRLFSFASFITVCLLVWILTRQYRIWLKESDTFNIRKIEIRGNELLSENEIFQIGMIDPTASIWNINLREVQGNVGSNVFVEEIKIDRIFPNLLRIRLREKSPVALLNVGGKFYCLDREGLVLPAKPGKLYDLPVISGDFRGAVIEGSRAGGQFVHQALNFLMVILADRPELYSSISEIVMGRPEGIVLYTHKGGVLVWVGREGYEWKIRYLEAILNELIGQKEISKVKYIDLRFKNQVIVGMRV